MERKLRALFAVVAACVAFSMLPTPAFAITRDIVLTRGMVWANFVRGTDPKTHAKITGVRYSQSRWAYESGSLIPTSTTNPSTKGYRTDCSGFVSMCWNLKDSSGHPYSSTTADMGAKGAKKFFQITKAQLQPGDAILKSTAWGAPTGHVIIFAGWVDSSQKSYWALEQTTSSSHNGTIYHARSYGEAYYRPYRYSGLQDMYADVEETVAGADAYRSAAAAADAAYPKTASTLVIASGAVWGDQITAASIAGAVHGPVLLTAGNSLPASTTAEIKRLKPKFIYLLGSSATVSSTVQSQIASLCPSVARINGKNYFEVAANSLSTTMLQAKNAKHPVDTVYIASGDQAAEALSIAPVLSRASRPLLFVHATSIPTIVLTRLKASKVKKVVIVGGPKSVSTGVEAALTKAGYKVTRITGTDPYKASVAIALYAQQLNLGFTWKRVGVASPASCSDALAWASANGVSGSMYLTTGATKLDSYVRTTVAAHHTEIGKARVYGGPNAVKNGALKTLAIALRSGK